MEGLSNETAKKYPYIFNLFVDYRYLNEKDYEVVNDLLRENSEKNINNYKPIYLDGKLFDVNSDIDLISSTIEILPENLHLGGKLFLENCANLRSLPKGLEVKEDLYLSNSAIESIPRDLKVGGNLYIQDCNNLKFLPKDLKVDGEIFR